jgi:hypothetical protein
MDAKVGADRRRDPAMPWVEDDRVAVWRAQRREVDTRAAGELGPLFVRARGRKADGADNGRAGCDRDGDPGRRSARPSSLRLHLAATVARPPTGAVLGLLSFASAGFHAPFRPTNQVGGTWQCANPALVAEPIDVS